MNRYKLFTILAVFASTGLYASSAQAKGKGDLANQPSVRRKKVLRKFRFQVTPYVGMSLSQPFVHMGYVGGRVGVHFTDWLGLRAGFGYGVVPIESKLLKAVNRQLPRGIAPGTNDDQTGMPCAKTVPCRSIAERNNPAPLRHDFRAGLVRAQWQASVDVIFTPFAGKIGLFENIFTEYDMYLFGGLGLMGYKKHYGDESTTEALGCTANNTQNDNECLLHPVSADDGVKVGGSFGAGVHLFITDWVSINLEIQDVVVGVNLTGLNANVQENPIRVDKDDRDAFHNVTFQLGFKFYLPPKAKRSK